MTKLCVIDGDIVAYRCAAANEKRGVIATHKETLEKLTFDTATAFKEWAGESADEYELVATQVAEPVENALHSVKNVIASIVEKAGCDIYHVVVSGKENFRLDIPLPTRYKDSRKETVRPVQLKECKQYLIEQHGAEVSDGVEADDVLVAYAVDGYNNGKYVVQATLDKDARHGPGWLFDWTTMEKPELIEGYGELYIHKSASGVKSVKGHGRAFLWFQIVFGDPVDSYKPCELAKAKFGAMGAYKILKDAKSDVEALTAIVDQYKKWYPKPITYRAWDESLHKDKSWLDIMQMYADCAFMRRYDGDRLVVKELLGKLKVPH